MHRVVRPPSLFLFLLKRLGPSSKVNQFVSPFFIPASFETTRVHLSARMLGTIGRDG